jgi:hypothetical protein
MINMYEHQSLIASMKWVIPLGRLDIKKTAMILTTSSFIRSASPKGHPHRTKNVKRYKAGCKYKSVNSCTTIPNYSNLPKCNNGQNSLIGINASLRNTPFDATKSPNGHPVLFTQHVNANLFHFWIYGRLETAPLPLRDVDSTLYHLWNEWRTQFDLYLAGLPTVEAIIIAKHISTHIVWGVTTFPQSWLGTLLYSYAVDGNAHIPIRRHGHIREQYDQGDIEHVSLCLYGRRAGIRPGSSYHGTVL